ncbi:uncharacterized protein LOC134249188 [Saccostrea cucullata]|uniref:uncharacterized protein LOC134249188 n=1 Tax=Saccostrea cuccullata TaxID=36930 RepID=UPI002ED49CD7
MYFCFSMAILISFGILFLSTSGNGQTNLPKKIVLRENTKTGTEIFRVEFDERVEGGNTPLRLYNMFPIAANDIFEFNERNQSIIVKNGTLLDFEGDDKAYVIRLQKQLTVTDQELSQEKKSVFLAVTPSVEDLTVLIELQDVVECSQFVSSSLSSFSSSSSSEDCCDHYRRTIWLTPVSSILEVIVIVISFVIVMMCFVKKERITRVEAFSPRK